MNEPTRFRRLWATPVLLALCTTVGLLSALLADGVGDAASWVALAVPVAVIARYTFFRGKSRE